MANKHQNKPVPKIPVGSGFAGQIRYQEALDRSLAGHYPEHPKRVLPADLAATLASVREERAAAGARAMDAVVAKDRSKDSLIIDAAAATGRAKALEQELQGAGYRLPSDDVLNAIRPRVNPGYTPDTKPASTPRAVQSPAPKPRRQPDVTQSDAPERPTPTSRRSVFQGLGAAIIGTLNDKMRGKVGAAVDSVAEIVDGAADKIITPPADTTVLFHDGNTGVDVPGTLALPTELASAEYGLQPEAYPMTVRLPDTASNALETELPTMPASDPWWEYPLHLGYPQDSK
jgi:hypothetical protein